MMELEEGCFSRGGKYFASWSSESELKIWNSSTGSLHQTLTSKHLKGKLSCLAWSRDKQSTRKRRSSSHLLIAGAVGSKVIVWNLAKKEEEVVLSEHSDQVTCIDWDLGKCKLYSGSKDKHVVEWNVDTGISARKWKAGKVGVECVCCYGDGSVVLTAGRSIKMWSLESCTLIKKVTGHASTIKKLCFLTHDSFLSSAHCERVINYWHTSSPSSLATLTCEEEVLTFDCCVDEAIAKVAAVSEDGVLFLYQFSLSQTPSPLSATSTIRFVTSPPKPSSPSPLPVLATLIQPSEPHLLSVAHSSAIRPSIESIEFHQPDEHVCLVRDAISNGLLLASQVSSNSPPVELDKVTVLGPGNMTLPTHQLPALPSVDSRPLSARLEPEMKSKTPGPSADSLTQLLVQSVASGDGKLLEEVLRISKERLVTATVKRMPVHIVLPFLRKLIEMLQSSPSRGLQLSLWIKTVLSSHAAYLMTVPQLSATLSGLHQLLESRVTTFSRLCHLQGKLELMLAQGEVEDGGMAAAGLALTTPLLTVTIPDASPGAMVTESDAEDWESESDDQSEEHSTEEVETMDT